MRLRSPRPPVVAVKTSTETTVKPVQWGHSETSGGAGDEYECLHQSLDPEQEDTALPVPVLS